MKPLFFVLIFWFCCDVSYGFRFNSDLYSTRYARQNSTFDALFTPTPVASTGIQALINAAPSVDNNQCKTIHQFATTSTIQQLVNFQHELLDLCPQLYKEIRGKNITKWGSVDEFLQIWYMKFIDKLWLKIQAKTCRCQLYDDFVIGAAAASDTALRIFLEANYDPTLCVINDQTMFYWNRFLNKPEIKKRAAKYIRIGEFSLTIIHDISKSYLPDARYQMYFEPGPPYQISTYLNATKTNPDFSAVGRASIQGHMREFNTEFPAMNLAGRQNFFLMMFCVELDYSNEFYYLIYNRIPLDPTDDITFYHLALYLCRKDFLTAKRLQYASPAAGLCTTTTQSTTTTASTTSTTTTTTTLPPTCEAPPGSAKLFIEHGIVFQDENAVRKAKPVGNCNHDNGIVVYYNGSTLQNYRDRTSYERVWVGHWEKSFEVCSSPCLCTATACYIPHSECYDDDPYFPEISLYPHCTSPNNCFIAAGFSCGSFVNPLNETDRFNDVQEEGDVTLAYYPKITRIGCNGCPVVATPTVCTCPPPPTPTPDCVAGTSPPSGTAELFVGNDVVIEYDWNFPNADPVSKCMNPPKGYTAYYNGSTPANHGEDYFDRDWVGYWVRANCSSPCICTATACYNVVAPEGAPDYESDYDFPGFGIQLGNPDIDPVIALYPHCTATNTCFIAAVIATEGSLVNQLNATDIFTFVNQQDSDDVTLPSYPKITKIGCGGCPVTV